MKHILKRNTFLVIASTALATAAFAGRVNPVTVQINDTWNPANEFGRSANGSIGATYNSTNTVEFIGCTLSTVTQGQYATCQARDTTGLTRTCFTWNPKHIDILRELRSDSEMYFQWNEDGSCRRVWVRQRSENQPKRFTP
jgi:hypothetical protein